MKKEEDVKIVQIVCSGGNWRLIFGLGSDGQIYNWSHDDGFWYLWKLG